MTKTFVFLIDEPGTENDGRMVLSDSPDPVTFAPMIEPIGEVSLSLATAAAFAQRVGVMPITWAEVDDVAHVADCGPFDTREESRGER